MFYVLYVYNMNAMLRCTKDCECLYRVQVKDLVWGLCLYRCRGPWVFYAQCGGGCDCMGFVGLQVSVDDVGV